MGGRSNWFRWAAVILLLIGIVGGLEHPGNRRRKGKGGHGGQGKGAANPGGLRPKYKTPLMDDDPPFDDTQFTPSGRLSFEKPHKREGVPEWPVTPCRKRGQGPRGVQQFELKPLPIIKTPPAKPFTPARPRGNSPLEKEKSMEAVRRTFRDYFRDGGTSESKDQAFGCVYNQAIHDKLQKEPVALHRKCTQDPKHLLPSKISKPQPPGCLNDPGDPGVLLLGTYFLPCNMPTYDLYASKVHMLSNLWDGEVVAAYHTTGALVIRGYNWVAPDRLVGVGRITYRDQTHAKVIGGICTLSLKDGGTQCINPQHTATMNWAPHHEVIYNPKSNTLLTMVMNKKAKLVEYDLSGNLVWWMGMPSPVKYQHYNSIFWMEDEGEEGALVVNDFATAHVMSLDRATKRINWCTGTAAYCRPMQSLVPGVKRVFLHQVRPLRKNLFTAYANSYENNKHAVMRSGVVVLRYLPEERTLRLVQGWWAGLKVFLKDLGGVASLPFFEGGLLATFCGFRKAECTMMAFDKLHSALNHTSTGILWKYQVPLNFSATSLPSKYKTNEKFTSLYRILPFSKKPRLHYLSPKILALSPEKICSEGDHSAEEVIVHDPPSILAANAPASEVRCLGWDEGKGKKGAQGHCFLVWDSNPYPMKTNGTISMEGRELGFMFNSLWVPTVVCVSSAARGEVEVALATEWGLRTSSRVQLGG